MPPETKGIHRIVFQPSGRQGDVSDGANLLDAARGLGVEIESICNGRQTCGKCQVTVEPGYFPKYGITSAAEHLVAIDNREARYFARRPALPGRRLACACRVTGDLVLFVPEESQARKQVVRKAASERAIEIDPAMRLYYVEVAAAPYAGTSARRLGPHRGGAGRGLRAEGRAAGPPPVGRAAGSRAPGRLEGDRHDLAGA